MLRPEPFVPRPTGIAVYGGTHGRTFAAALQDLREGTAQYQFWHQSALNDLRARYRRSALGEFWISINLAIFVLAIGFFYGALLHLDPARYLPHLLVGYTFWILFSTLVVDACQAFIANGPLLQQRRTPLSVIALRNVDRAFIAFAHNFVVVAVGLVLLRVFPTWHLVLLLPALALWCFNGIWLALALGIVCVRFRDIPPAVLSLIPLIFLISPVLWQPEDVPQALQAVVTWNPLAHFLAIARDPLLGREEQPLSWTIALGTTFVGWSLALLLLRFYRTRVVYWV